MGLMSFVVEGLGVADEDDCGRHYDSGDGGCWCFWCE